MALRDQNVGIGDELAYAGDDIPIEATITTGGPSSGVTVAEFGLFDTDPNEANGPLTPLVSKSLGSGISVVDGAVSGTVLATILLDPDDTSALAGDYFHELRLTTAGNVRHVSRGVIRLQRSGL